MTEIHSRERIELTRVGAAIEHAPGHGEEQSRDDAVRKHLQHCTRHTERVSGRQPEQHETHVADTRIANDEFEIALAKCYCRSVKNSDNGENRDPITPRVETLGKKIHRDAQSAVRAEFHYNAREQH